MKELILLALAILIIGISNGQDKINAYLMHRDSSRSGIVIFEKLKKTKDPQLVDPSGQNPKQYQYRYHFDIESFYRQAILDKRIGADSARKLSAKYDLDTSRAYTSMNSLTVTLLLYRNNTVKMQIDDDHATTIRAHELINIDAGQHYPFNQKYSRIVNGRATNSKLQGKIYPQFRLDKKANELTDIAIDFAHNNSFFSLIMLNGKSYQIEVLPLMLYKGYSSKNISINISNPDSVLKPIDNFNVLSYKVGDTYHSKNYDITIDSMDIMGTYLYLTVNKPSGEKRKGDLPGYFLHDFSLQVLADTSQWQSLHKEFAKREYTLIDFWGSWCGPCIEDFPRLRNMTDSLNAKEFAVIGIACEYLNKPEAARTVVKEKQLDRTDYFIDIFAKGNIVSQLKINTYPTYLLVDRDGKIIFRSRKNKLEEVFDFLRSKTSN